MKKTSSNTSFTLQNFGGLFPASEQKKTADAVLARVKGAYEAGLTPAPVAAPQQVLSA